MTSADFELNACMPSLREPVSLAVVRLGSEAHSLDCCALESLAVRLANRPDLVRRWIDVPEHPTPQWLASRLALLNAARAYSESSDPLLASIAHCPTHAAAAVVPKGAIVGLGLDIERSDRPISNALFHRLEASFPMGNEPHLHRWLRYEAAVKADPDSFGAQGIALSQEPHFVFGRQGIRIETHIGSLSGDELSVAIAFARFDG